MADAAVLTPPVDTPAPIAADPAATPPAQPPTPPAVEKPAETPPVAETPTPESKDTPVVEALDPSKLTLPDGAALTPAEFTRIADQAKTLGLSQVQAQRFVDARAAEARSAAEGFLADLKADPDLGGTKFDATVAAAQRGRDFLVPAGTPHGDAFRAFCDQTGLGNHPALVAAFARVAQMRKEDQPPAVVTPPKAPPKATSDVLYPKTAVTS